MASFSCHCHLRNHGQATVELLVAGAALWVALFVIEIDGRTSAQWLAEALRLFFRNLTFFVSLP